MVPPSTTTRQPIPLPRVLLVCSLILLCATSLAAVRLLDRPNGNPHLNAAETITYSRIPFILLPMATGPLCVLILLALTIWWSRRREPGRWLASIALVLSVLGHQALFLSWFLPSESWSVEDYITGQDGSRYYFLHCPPPLNGPGHYAVACRVSGSPQSYTVRTEGHFDRYGTFTPYGAANPPLAATAKVLWARWQNGQQRRP